MPDLTIKDAPEETVKALEAIAQKSRRTVSAVALDYLPKRAPMSSREHAVAVETLRERSAHESSRPDSKALIRRDRDGVAKNDLEVEEAVRLSRELRSRALKAMLPDSTPAIRAYRDTR